jgi:hypothetical protein
MADLTEVAVLPGVLIREQRLRRLAMWTPGGRSSDTRLAAARANAQRRGSTTSRHDQGFIPNRHAPDAHDGVPDGIG